MSKFLMMFVGVLLSLSIGIGERFRRSRTAWVLRKVVASIMVSIAPASASRAISALRSQGDAASGSLFFVDLLIPNNVDAGRLVYDHGEPFSGTATSKGLWNTGDLGTFLTLSGGSSPANPIGAFLNPAEVNI